MEPSPVDATFTGLLFWDEFTFSPLTRETGNLTVCQKGLCCHLNYRMMEQQKDEVYVLGAFDGLHEIEGKYYLQVLFLSLGEIEYLSFFLSHGVGGRDEKGNFIYPRDVGHNPNKVQSFYFSWSMEYF